MNRDMLSRRLERRGYAVAVAADGHQALEMIGARPFDAVLLDIMMPGISGLEVLKTLRERYSVADLPVIMATAKDESSDIVAALNLGANDYVTKPLDFPVVLARVQTQLSLKRAREEIQRLAEQLELRNRFIRETFGRYVTNEVVASLLDSPEGLQLGGGKRKVTIVMSDLRGFTSLSERLSPEQVVAIVNRYLGNHGRCYHAVPGHQRVHRRCDFRHLRPPSGGRTTRNARWPALWRCSWPWLRSMNRIGMRACLKWRWDWVNTGEVVVGNIGSHKRTKVRCGGKPCQPHVPDRVLHHRRSNPDSPRPRSKRQGRR